MNGFVRFALGVTLLVGLTVGVAYAQPVWIADLGLDFWKLPELEQKLTRATDLNGELDAHLKQLQEKTARKAQVLQQLIDSKLSLYEATAQLENLTDPQHMEIAFFELGLEQKSREEALFCLVLYWAERALDSDPQRAKAVRTRLEAEMQQHLPTATFGPAQ